ncbi:MAG TPA: zinc-binding dehydrogenase [Thermoanaerobaculia bacterium]|jgi:NADPH:quinone reductase-like Zn-dependent oxidoreductase
MKAIQLDGPGEPEALHLRDLPLPRPPAGWVRIRIEAFGINRSELHLRQGVATNATFPRVPGIECAGTIDDPAGTPFARGQKVVAMMGGMGRAFDGGYAQFTVVPASQVIPIDTELPWEVVGAVPEMLQTAYGSLTTGLDLRANQWLLIRGGTTSVGLAAAALARRLGAKVIATTRRPERLTELAARGVDHPLLDSGSIADAVRELVPDGVHAVLELIGTSTLPDSLRAARVHGTVCFTGMVSDEWIVRDFYPIGYIPNGVRLTAYGGEAADLPQQVMQEFLDEIAAGRLSPSIHRVFELEEIVVAHTLMETNAAVGKMVVRVRHA